MILCDQPIGKHAGEVGLVTAPRREPGNPVEELLVGLERIGWRATRSPWGEMERRLRRVEERREELLVAWRRRRIRPVPEEDEDGVA